jgi:retinol dehydrogenase-12
VLFTRALSDCLRNTPIIIDAADPGLCASELRRNIGGLRGVIMYLMDLLIAWTPEQGSRNLLFAALAGSEDKDEEENFRGAFISRFNTAQFSPFVRSEEGREVQERLWVRIHSFIRY